MAGVEDWSTDASSNTATPPTGAPEGMAPSAVNNTMRQMMANTRKEFAMSSLTATATFSIGSLGNGYIHAITDAGKSISSFDSIAAGIQRTVVFDVSAVLVHDATKMILPGAANITTGAGDVAVFRSEGGGNWKLTNYLDAARPPVRPALSAEQATTSGTDIDFIGIPSWAKKISILFAGVSTSGTADWLVQLGDAGGFEEADYVGGGSNVGASVAANNSVGFLVHVDVTAAATRSGIVTLMLEDASDFTWCQSGILTRADAAGMDLSSGYKSLSAALTQVRITTVGGTETFDAGAISIQYE